MEAPLALTTHNFSQEGPSSLFLQGPPPHRQRRARTAFSGPALARLEAVFTQNQYPDIMVRERLSDELGVPEARIQTWFQNKRSRTKRSIKQKAASPQGHSADSQGQASTPVHENSNTSAAKVTKPQGHSTSTTDTPVLPTRVPATKNWLLPSAEETHKASKGFRPFYREPSPTEQAQQEKDVYIKAWLKNCELVQHQHQQLLQAQAAAAYMNMNLPLSLGFMHPLYSQYQAMDLTRPVQPPKFPVAKNLTPLFGSPPAGSQAPSPALPLATSLPESSATHQVITRSTGLHDNTTTDDITTLNDDAITTPTAKGKGEEDLDVCN